MSKLNAERHLSPEKPLIKYTAVTVMCVIVAQATNGGQSVSFRCLGLWSQQVNMNSGSCSNTTATVHCRPLAVTVHPYSHVDIQSSITIISTLTADVYEITYNFICHIFLEVPYNSRTYFIEIPRSLYCPIKKVH